MLDAFEFPPQQQKAFRKAKRLEWWSLAYQVSALVAMYLVLGSSQAMKTAWMEDLLSLIPPIVFLLAGRIAYRAPDSRFCYGYHRSVSIAFLIASAALFFLGGWLLVDAGVRLVQQEHPTIGGISLFGQTFWLGWLMLPALIWSAVPSAWLGRWKLPLAREIHDKVLFADADMNKANWMTATAAMAGVLGVGFGWWWIDAVAAGVISLSVLRDGYKNMKEVVLNLMDAVPKTVDGAQIDPLLHRLRATLEALPWAGVAEVRLRENGHVFFGEAIVETQDDSHIVDKCAQAKDECFALDWRLYDFHVIPVHFRPSPEAEEESGDEPGAERAPHEHDK